MKYQLNWVHSCPLMSNIPPTSVEVEDGSRVVHVPRTDVAKRAVGAQRCGSTPQPQRLGVFPTKKVPINSYTVKGYMKANKSFYDLVMSNKFTLYTSRVCVGYF